MIEIIFTSNYLTTVASIITISYFTKDVLKYLINLLRNYITNIKNELINQMKNLIIESIGDKLNIKKDMKIDDDKINNIFEDIPTPTTFVNDFLKDGDEVKSGYEIIKKGKSKHSQIASAALYPEKYNNVKYIGATGEYHDIPMYIGNFTHNGGNDLTRPIHIENLESHFYNKTQDYGKKMKLLYLLILHLMEVIHEIQIK